MIVRRVEVFVMNSLNIITIYLIVRLNLTKKLEKKYKNNKTKD